MDFGQILSQGPASRDSVGNIDLYTYVANIESPSTDEKANGRQTQPLAEKSKTTTKIAVGSEINSTIQTDYPPPRSTGVEPIYYPSGPGTKFHGTPTQHYVVDYSANMCSGLDKSPSSNTVNQPCTDFTQISDMPARIEHQLRTQVQGQERLAPKNIESVGSERNMTDVWWDKSFNEFETDLFGLLYGEYSWPDGGNFFLCG